MEFLKKIIIFGAIAGAFYFLLSNHFIIYGTKVKLLKKSELSLKYTIYNAKGKTNSTILKIKDLYNDGIGELLVEMGKMTEEELELSKEKLEEDEY